MGLRQLINASITLVFVCAFALGQSAPTDADKEKADKELRDRVMQLLDKAVGEAVELRLPQNRAIVYALTADMYWKFDAKRGRELFQNSASEIIAFNQETEKEKRESPASNNAFFEISDFRGDIRNEILPLVAKHDAELALDMLVQTRPARLSEAIARSAETKASSDMLTYNPDRIRVSQELALEQQFALLAADENPERAIKLIRDSLSKGVSQNVLALLQKLFRKDEKKATDLAGEVIKKFVDTDLSKSNEDMQMAMMFLQFAFKPSAPMGNPKEKQFNFTESQAKDLAAKIANTLLNGPKTFAMTETLSRAMPMLEKFVPDKVAMLKQRKAENDAGLPPEFRRMQEQQKMYDPNSTPEDIIAQVPKMQNEFERSMAYQVLSTKIGQIEDEARAKKLIDQIPDEKVKTSLMERFESARIDRNAVAGKIDDARRTIAILTNKRTRIQKLVNLAIQIHKKGGEKDIATAVELMTEATAQTSEYPETLEDMNEIMEVVRGYAIIDKESAFRMFEPIVVRLNEHMQASATLAGFNPQNSNFKRGELMLTVGSRTNLSPLVGFIPQMQMLGKADLDRMMAVTERFARSDARAVVRLYVLQGFLREEKKPDAVAKDK